VSPTSTLAASAGIETCGEPSVAWNSPRRPGLPSFITMTAPAPAAAALSTFSRKKHPPRWRSATAPRGNDAKSAASQPLVEALAEGLGRSRSTATTGASTAPLPE
jgi:hypothetical protein